MNKSKIFLKDNAREKSIKKYSNVVPHKIFQTPNSLKWFNKHFDDNFIKKSIYSLFPNNCEPMLKEITPMRMLMEWLSHYCKPTEKNKNLLINPKYFFSTEIYQKILKLKDIFLEFDEDGSRKMEIDEMVTMFKTNHINVTEDELCSLFFKGKKYKKEDINKLYLDFYQFMQFALDKKSNNDFANFMKKIKEKLIKEKQINKSNIIPEKDVKNALFLNKNVEEPLFLPMNFNLVLDYFIKKGKERQSQKKIRRAIKKMKNFMNSGSFPEDDKDFKEEGENIEEEKKNIEKIESKKSAKNLKKKEFEDEYDKQCKEINTKEIMKEFEKLFNLSISLQIDSENGKKNIKKPKKITNSKKSEKNLLNKKIEAFSSTLCSSVKNEEDKTTTSYITSTVRQNFIFTNLIKKQLDKKAIYEMNKKNYAKFHSVELAKNESNKCLINKNSSDFQISEYKKKEKHVLPYINFYKNSRLYSNNYQSLMNHPPIFRKCSSTSNISVKNKKCFSY